MNIDHFIETTARNIEQCGNLPHAAEELAEKAREVAAGAESIEQKHLADNLARYGREIRRLLAIAPPYARVTANDREGWPMELRKIETQFEDSVRQIDAHAERLDQLQQAGQSMPLAHRALRAWRECIQQDVLDAVELDQRCQSLIAELDRHLNRARFHCMPGDQQAYYDLVKETPRIIALIQQLPKLLIYVAEKECKFSQEDWEAYFSARWYRSLARTVRNATTLPFSFAPRRLPRTGLVVSALVETKTIVMQGGERTNDLKNKSVLGRHHHIRAQGKHKESWP